MLNNRALIQGTVIGTVLQLAMVISGHFVPSIAALFAPVGMGISLVAGLMYAKAAAPGTTGNMALGGLAAGGLCAFIGIVVSYLLGDVPAMIIAMGTCGSAVTGAIGGVIGKYLFAGAPSAAPSV
jgi:hypothetical protein